MTTSELTQPTGSAATQERALSRRTSFWSVAAILGLYLMASTAPSPMYSIYQQRWGFSTAVLTEVFAVYTLAILVALLLFGSLSDRIGRRPVLLTSLAVEILSVVVLAVAPGVGWLYLGRVLQGLATGMATSTISGALLDFQPRGSSKGPFVNALAATFGMALGSVVAGALVQFAPAPTTLTYVVLLVGLVLAVAVVLAMPESVVGQGHSKRDILRPQRPTVPAGHGVTFALLATTMLATWIVGGMFMSLGPSVAKSLVSGNPYFVGGLSVGVVAGFGGLAQLILGGWSGRRAVRVGAPLQIVGLLGVAAAELSSSAWVFFGSSAVLGVGWGLMFMGGFRLLTGLATPEHRAGTSAMIYVVAYLSAGVPAVTIGFLATAFGLTTATLIFTAAAGLFTAVGGLSTFVHRQ